MLRATAVRVRVLLLLALPSLLLLASAASVDPFANCGAGEARPASRGSAHALPVLASASALNATRQFPGSLYRLAAAAVRALTFLN